MPAIVSDVPLSTALKHLSEPLPTLPANLAMYQAFLNKLTAKEREERYASGSEILKAPGPSVDASTSANSSR